MTAAKDPKILHVSVRTEDKATLVVYAYEDGSQILTFKMTDELLKILNEITHGNITYGTHEILLAQYDSKTKLLTTHPTTLLPGSPYFGHQKYVSIKRISLEHARPILVEEFDETRLNLRQFPPGFAYDPYDGLGLIYALRFIVEAIEELSDVEEIRLCDDDAPSVRDKLYRLPDDVYDVTRKTVGRMHRAAVGFANKEKRSFLYTQLVDSHLPAEDRNSVFQRNFGELKKILDSASQARTRYSKTRDSNEAAAVRVVKTSAKALISDYPEEIFELNREIELVTLEEVIFKFEAKLADNKANENSWQKFLSNNPFILRLAFGLPAIIFKEQMPVGGWNLDNRGGKLADFVVKSGAIGNLAIVEIKTPKSKLLGKNEYRGGVYAPSVGISGAVTQVIDQKYHLQRNITMLLGNSPNTDASTYAVGCIVIAGSTPKIDAEKKSFELYRNNLSGVTIITFDELLNKLKALLQFLSDHPRPSEVEEETEYGFDEDEYYEDDGEDDTDLI